jgi:hypothetical protein
MQEVNFKNIYNFQFILLTFPFRAQSLHRKFQLQYLWICALAWWCHKYNLTSHTHHTSSTLHWQLFASPTRYSHMTPSRTENDQHLLSDVPVYKLSLSFPLCFSWWGIDNLYVVFPYSIKKRVITDCWLRNEYSVRLITKLEQQVVMHWNAILLQLVYGSTIYRPVCLFLYIKLQLEL